MLADGNRDEMLTKANISQLGTTRIIKPKVIEELNAVFVSGVTYLDYSAGVHPTGVALGRSEEGCR